jgi:DNA-directed RNA polymerase subunit RPC12/RpoP
MKILISESQFKNLIKEYNDGGSDYIKCDHCYGLGKMEDGEMCDKCDGTGKMSPNAHDLASGTDRFLAAPGADTFAGCSPPDGPNTSLTEKIENGKVFCDKCGWSWNISDGGKDTYVCHKCGHDNSIKENGGLTSKQIKSIEDINKDAKFVKCKNCKKKFTQTTHKGKKSLPICPHCGTHN